MHLRRRGRPQKYGNRKARSCALSDYDRRPCATVPASTESLSPPFKWSSRIAVQTSFRRRLYVGMQTRRRFIGFECPDLVILEILHQLLVLVRAQLTGPDDFRVVYVGIVINPLVKCVMVGCVMNDDEVSPRHVV